MLKNSLLLGLLLQNVLLFYCLTAKGQDAIPLPPCKEVKIANDSTKRKILFSFMKSALRERHFVNDKGIIHLYLYTDKNGLIYWKLIPVIDDRYKDNPPQSFEALNGDIVLVYEADSLGQVLITPNPDSFIRCLEQVIGDRVYTRPIIDGRWSSKRGGEGVRRPNLIDGELVVVFDKNGNYRYIKSD